MFNTSSSFESFMREAEMSNDTQSPGPNPPTTPKLKFTRAGCEAAETTRRGVKPTISILKPSQERATTWNNSSGTF